MYNLIFFSLISLFNCQRKKPDEIRLRWNNQRANGIAVAKSLLTGNDDSPERRVTVRLRNEGEHIAMLGTYKVDDNEIIFEPLVPFTRGLRYEVLVDDQVVKEIAIPLMDQEGAPVLLAIYPTQDTVPENLLKIYLQFSQPMREGESVHHLTLFKNDHDTLPGVFLDLQPELWNEDRTMLTVWLDPGRIKRGLQPNKQLGAPLHEGGHYTLVVSDHWKDVQGSALTSTYFKEFVTIKRDSLSPDPRAWTVHAPAPGTLNELDIDVKAPLDYSLLNNTLLVVDETDKIVLGNWHIDKEEKNVHFRPREPWMEGNYQLQIETRLEDLAGNNINRPFDVDVRTKVKQARDSKMVSFPFKINKALKD